MGYPVTGEPGVQRSKFLVGADGVWSLALRHRQLLQEPCTRWHTDASGRVPEAPALSTHPRYQINARTELAVRYNDISPLENHHCAIAFQILARPECNIFSSVPPEGFRQIRQVCAARALWGHSRALLLRGSWLQQYPSGSLKPAHLTCFLQGPKWSPRRWAFAIYTWCHLHFVVINITLKAPFEMVPVSLQSGKKLSKERGVTGPRQCGAWKAPALLAAW